MERTLTAEYRVEGVGLYPGISRDPTDAILDALDAAGAIDAVASASIATGFVSAMFTIDEPAGTATSASRGAAMAAKAFRAAGLGEPSRVTVVRTGDAEAIEDLELTVSAADLARELHVTRERIRQLTALEGFPAPVRRVGRSDLYRRADVYEFWMAYTVRRTPAEPRPAEWPESWSLEGKSRK